MPSTLFEFASVGLGAALISIGGCWQLAALTYIMMQMGNGKMRWAWWIYNQIMGARVIYARELEKVGLGNVYNEIFSD